MMTRTLMLPLFIVSCLWQVSKSVVLTPRNTLSACPGDEILVKCNESDTAAAINLRWILTLKNRQTPAAEMTLPPSGTLRNEVTIPLYIAEQQLIFFSELTSFSPLIAVFMTTAHPALNGAMVTCQSTLSMETLTIRVPETDQPEIRWLNITGGIFEEENLTAVIEWESNNGCLDFTISLTPSNDTSINYNITSTTKNTSHTFKFNVLYNTNYTVTVSSSSGNSSSEIRNIFNFVKCELPPHQENITIDISGYVSPALENTQISLSCPPGYSSPDKKGTNITSTCTREALWSPDVSQLDLKCKPRHCRQLSSKTDVYTLLNHTYSTTVGSVIQFECSQTHPITDLNKISFQAECLVSGLWQHDPQTICGRTTTINENSIMIMALGVGISLTLVCLICLGTATVALSCLVIRRKKKGNSKEEDKQSAEDSQNRDNHTIEHWGIYSLLSQPEAESQSTRNSAIYAEVGPTPKGKRAVTKRAVVMPDTTVQYAVVKQKQKQCEMDLDMNVVLSLDKLLMKIHSQVSPKWRQFGLAVRVPVEILNDLSTYREEDHLSEIADYWMKQHQGQLTWREVARIMKEIDLNDLAAEILSDDTGDTVEFQEDKASQDCQYQAVAELSSINLSDKHETETNDFITANIQAQSLETNAVS